MRDLVIAFADIETTGLEQHKGHRIIELGIGVWRYSPDTGARRKLGKTWLQRIDPKRDIDPGAQAVHGISLADLRGCPVWEDVAPNLHKVLKSTDVFIAHNAEFDAPFIALELARAGFPVPSFQIFCTMQNGRAATSMGKVPNLGELCWTMDVDYDPDAAHAADYDVECMEQAYWRGVERGLFGCPAQLCV